MKKGILFSIVVTFTLAVSPNTHAHTTDEALTSITDPSDFVVSLYGTVLASQFEKNTRAQYLKMANTYFSQDLNNDFQSVFQKDEKNTGELGCLDFIPFTNAQDLSRGFFVNTAKVNGNTAIVGVSISVGDITAFKQPSLFLHLQKANEGWHVQDIDYGKGKTTLANHLKACINQQKK